MKTSQWFPEQALLTVLLFVPAWFGCADTGQGGHDDVATADTGAACAAHGTVDTPIEAFGYLPDVWVQTCGAPGNAIRAGETFAVTTEIVLAASDIQLPDSMHCGESTPGCSNRAFRLELYGASTDKVEILESTEIGDESCPVRIRLQPGEYRWRSEIRSATSGEDISYASAVLVPGCAQPCPEGSYRCLDDMACYDSGTEFYSDTYCLYCLGLGPVVCPCLTADGQRPNGAPCAVMQDCDDTYVQGTCQDGTCHI